MQLQGGRGSFLNSEVGHAYWVFHSAQSSEDNCLLSQRLWQGLWGLCRESVLTVPLRLGDSEAGEAGDSPPVKWEVTQAGLLGVQCPPRLEEAVHISVDCALDLLSLRM